MISNDNKTEVFFVDKIVRGVCFMAILAMIAFGIKLMFYSTNEDGVFSENRQNTVRSGLRTSNNVEAVQAQSPIQKANVAFRQARKSKTRKDWEHCVKLYTELYESNASNGLFAFRKAFSLHACKRIDEAIEAHRVAAAFPRYKVLATYNLACAYALKKEKSQCLKTLKEAVDAGFKRRQGLLRDDTDFAFVKDDPEFKRLEKLSTPKKPKNLNRQFDFWVGSWDVFNKSGTKVGHNTISKSQNGFLLTEHWKSARGYTGTSINFVDPKDKKWKQVWIDQGGNITRYSGQFSKGSMRLSGSTHQSRGQTNLERVSFTLLPDGRVRQFAERSLDNGTTWKIYFEGFYKKDSTAKK